MAELTVHEHVLFPEDLDRRIRERAQAEGKSKAQVIRELCEEGLGQPSLEERQRALREFVGSGGWEVGEPEEIEREIAESRRTCVEPVAWGTMELGGKVALVTGGARRIGREIARHLGARGCHVAVNYHTSRAEAEELAAEIAGLGLRAVAVEADVSVAAEVAAMVQTVGQALGPVEVLVNNAALFYETPFPDVSEDQWDELLDTNLKGAFLCSREVSRGMLERQSGKIVNLADVSAFRPWPKYIPYCVSKAGLVALTKGLAGALAPHVQVNAVAPGAILWPEGWGEQAKQRAIAATPLRRTGEPEDVARTVMFLLEGSDYITGQVIAVDGGRSIA
ncbi:MAG: SDR family oxidoreductase [Armatimonadota bacterium]